MRGLPGDSESGENPIMPNKALKLTAPSVHAFCFATGVESLGPWAQKRAPRPAA